MLLLNLWVLASGTQDADITKSLRQDTQDTHHHHCHRHHRKSTNKMAAKRLVSWAIKWQSLTLTVLVATIDAQWEGM